MKSEITERLIAIITGIMQCRIDVNSNRDNTVNWDSLNQVRLILELNETFKIKIPFEEIGKLDSVEKIAHYITKFN